MYKITHSTSGFTTYFLFCIVHTSNQYMVLDLTGGVILREFASSVVDRGFKYRLGQTKDVNRYLLLLRIKE